MKQPFLISWVGQKATIIKLQKGQKAAMLKEIREKKGAVA